MTHLTKTDQADVAHYGTALTTSSAVADGNRRENPVQCAAEAGFLDTAPPPKPIR